MAIICIVLIDNSSSFKFNMIADGCTSYGCKRNCMNSDIHPTPGDNGFKIEIQGLNNNKYKPNKTYKGESYN
jgi:hypothetical protein